MINFKLDTTSEYVCNEGKWPKPCCDVMVESAELLDMGYMFFNMKPEEGYIDIYANIDPQRQIVTSFLIICKKDDGTQDDLEIMVSKPTDSVQYFKIMKAQGGKDFDDFIAEACDLINSCRLEQEGLYVDVVDDFLEEKDIRIPSSDIEMKEDGYGPDDNTARIYGSDYDRLSKEFAYIAGITNEQVIIDRLNLLLLWAGVYADEFTFYKEIKEFAYPEVIEKAWGRTERLKAEQFWKENGL